MSTLPAPEGAKGSDKSPSRDLEKKHLLGDCFLEYNSKTFAPEQTPKERSKKIKKIITPLELFLKSVCICNQQP